MYRHGTCAPRGRPKRWARHVASPRPATRRVAASRGAASAGGGRCDGRGNFRICLCRQRCEHVPYRDAAMAALAEETRRKAVY